MTSVHAQGRPNSSCDARRSTRVDQLIAAVAQSERSSKKASPGGKRLRAYIEKHATPHLRAIEAKIASELASRTINTHYLHTLRRRLACSFDGRLVALEKANRKLPLNKRASPSELIRRAIALKVHEQSNEIVPVRVELKSSGGYRAISNPGLEHRARQYIATSILSHLRQPLPSQYSAPGHGGRDEAIRRAEEALRAGYHWACHMDFRNAFPSCTAEQVYQLLGQHIHKGVIDNNILASSLRLRIRRPSVSVIKASNLEETARRYGMPICAEMEAISAQRRPHQRTQEPQGYPCTSRQHPPSQSEFVVSGLPQGFSTSAIVFEQIIANIFRACRFSRAVIVIIYADDILILARSRQAVDEAINIVDSAVRRSPYDSLRLSRTECLRAEDGLSFLGYDLKLTNEEIETRVSEKAWRGYEMKCREVLSKILSKRLQPVSRSAALLFNGFVAAQSRDDDVEYTALVTMERVACEIMNQAAGSAIEGAVSNKLLKLPSGRHLVDAGYGEFSGWHLDVKRRRRWRTSRRRIANRIPDTSCLS